MFNDCFISHGLLNFLLFKIRHMKKTKDEMRPEYKCADFAKLERGKFYAEVVKGGTSVALLEPTIAKAFPTSEAVNEALHGLLALAKRTTRITQHSRLMKNASGHEK